jgi:hypothetical protein
MITRKSNPTLFLGGVDGQDAGGLALGDAAQAVDHGLRLPGCGTGGYRKVT